VLGRGQGDQRENPDDRSSDGSQGDLLSSSGGLRRMIQRRNMPTVLRRNVREHTMGSGRSTLPAPISSIGAEHSGISLRLID
jgi:hypothetical protein